MTRRISSMLVALVFMAAANSEAQNTAPIGSLCNPATNYGGTGILTANSFCAYYQGITAAVSATPRYSSPAVNTDGAGTYYAQTGDSQGAPGTNAGFAKWDFDYAVLGASPTDVFRVSVDFNPAVGNAVPSYGFTFLGNQADALNGGYFQAFGFNNQTAGEYTQSLAYCGKDQACAAPLALAQIDIEAGSGNLPTTTTPEPASMVFMGTGLLGVLGGVTIRRRKKIAA